MTRIAVMGGGLIGARHVERILAHPTASCAGLIDPNPEVGQGLSVDRFDTLRDCAADGVIVATPTSLHTEHAKIAANHAIPVLIEKPVAGTLQDADQLSGIQTPILVGHHRRHHPRVKALKSILDQNEIGDPITATMIWAMRKPDAYFENNWRSTDGSPVLINLVHDLDLIGLYFGKITDIAALPAPPRRASNRIDAGAIALSTNAGVSVTISFSDTAPSPWGFEAGTGENPNIGTTHQDMMWITGTKGAVSFPSLTVWHGCDWSRPATAQPSLDIQGPDPLDAQLDHFLDVIAGRAMPMCSLADGRAALAAALDIEHQLQQRLIPC
ncbi:MAG: Gfo/Idh/MocA family protein [Paracoccaceae bacterium]